MSTRKRVFPKHIGSARVFKDRKRRELAELLKAIEAVEHGCAYTPMRDVGVLRRTVEGWRQSCSVKEWGR